MTENNLNVDISPKHTNDFIIPFLSRMGASLNLEGAFSYNLKDAISKIFLRASSPEAHPS